MKISRRLQKRVAFLLLNSLLIQLTLPSVAYALTSGPSQPEFSGFQPVASTDLVNKFTGDFSYSIPVIEVPGPQGSTYPLTLAYHSGASSEDEASWVGYGWNLNPGAINRSTRGLPDDFHDEQITTYNKVPQNFTLTTGIAGGLEAFSFDKFGFNVNANAAIRYNNYSGFGYDKGIGISLGKGLISLGVSESDGQKSYSARVNPMAILSILTTSGGKPEKNPYENANFSGEKSLRSSALRTFSSFNSKSLIGGNHGSLDYNEGNRPNQVTSYTGKSYNITIGATATPGPIPVGVSGNISGSYSYQDSKESDDMRTYGYMYSAEANTLKNSSDLNNKDVLSDYYMEKDSPYNVRDVFIGIPFNNSDIYNVTGEGIGGTFQLHQPKVGEFGPNIKQSNTEINNVGADVSVGWTFGAGIKKSKGSHTLTESAWDDLHAFSSMDDKQKPYFRFVNDLAGNAGPVEPNDAAIAAAIRGTKLEKSPLARLEAWQNRPQQGSHIGQHTVAEAQRLAMFRYCKRADIAALRHVPLKANSATTTQTKAIAEFSVTNESGKNFIYGLPVYAKNEWSMQYGMQGLTAANIENNFLAYSTDKTTQVGELRRSAYATSYLLTEIVSPDYVDRTLDGPTPTDFGSYVAFSYIKQHGAGNANWYHWRMPYQGHVYNRNSISDPLDDMGSFSEGDKEIYQLQAVRTKTHTAIFTTSVRQDGVDALSGDDARKANANPNLTQRNKLSKLDYIELYANEDVEPKIDPTTKRVIWQPISSKPIPLKKVSFHYDYSLCPGTVNSIAGGKLTLQSITTEYNGQTTQKPYEFHYTYPTYDAKDYPDVYPDIYRTSFAVGYKDLEENPTYSKFSLDAWGNYQPNGEARQRSMQSWLNQSEYTSKTFDPAAWQLKRITLPSGGEIHVQYEEDDYAYVQNQTAHAMVTLDQGYNNATSEYEYVVDPATAGIKGADIDRCVDLIKKLYVDTGQRMYFKFLYKLINNNNELDINACNVEYITGYVVVRGVSVIDKKIKLQIGDPKEEYTIPRQVCQDFTQTQRLGKLRLGTTCDPQQVGVDTKADPQKLLRQFGAWVKAVNLPARSYLCAKINPSLSYFKLPMPTSKRGGGLRVKRLLTFDKGLDGIPVLYGSEYEYRAYDKLIGDWRSSGVATTEPTSMREENALVAFIPRLSQSKLSKIIAGPDRKQSEGPLGESLLPGASVGYSRVTVKNIHSGKTNPGYSISEYYTCQEFPMEWRKTPLISQREYNTLFTGLFNSVTNDVRATQGFSFILNSMHGQPKREATYAGSYVDINTKSNTNSTLISEQQYSYFAPQNGETIRIQDQPESSGKKSVWQDFPGRDVDVTMAQRAVQDRTNDVSVEVDADFTPFFPLGILWVTGSVSLSKFRSDFYTHTTSKVIRYPAIVKQVVSFHDGVRDTVENLAFDRYTGTPVAVKTTDAGRGAYLKQDVMASWVYPEMQGKAQNEGLVLHLEKPSNTPPTTTIRPDFVELTTGPVNGAIYLKAKNTADCSLLASIRKGDILSLEQLNAKDDVTSPYSTVYFADAPDIAHNTIRLYPYPASSSPSSGSYQQVRIISSGNSNELQSKIGSTTYHRANRKLMSLDDNASIYKPYTTASNQDALSDDLQVAIQSIRLPLDTKDIALTGTYTNVNITGFKDRLPNSCKSINAADATISNLQFTISKDATNGAIKVQLTAFDIDCGGKKTVR